MPRCAKTDLADADVVEHLRDGVDIGVGRHGRGDLAVAGISVVAANVAGLAALHGRGRLAHLLDLHRQAGHAGDRVDPRLHVFLRRREHAENARRRDEIKGERVVVLWRDGRKRAGNPREGGGGRGVQGVRYTLVDS